MAVSTQNPSGAPQELVPDTDEQHVGVRLRELRMGRRLTLKTVAERAGVSESFLSQVERGRAAPSLKTFQRLAQALGLDAGDIFADRGMELPQLTPLAGRAVLSLGSLAKFRVSPHAITNVEVIGGVFEPHGTAGEEPYTHGDSDEVCIVIDGRVRAEVDGTFYDMGVGDSLCYRSSMPHTFHNLGEERAEVLWIICPPSW